MSRILIILMLIFLGACRPKDDKTYCNDKLQREQHLINTYGRARLIPYEYNDDRRYIVKTSDSKILYIEYFDNGCEDYTALELLQ